ncbi:MAG: Peptidoglycan-binding domain 1 protein, partial [Solirubrobacterales bacterium]|nr:Peptidoglycan-binding domain 1 protein [Solirubrobacterales bacterium]
MKNRALPWAFSALALTSALSLTALNAPPADARFGDASLRMGDSGRDVRVLQRWMTRVGMETDVDGRFGKDTRTSVRRYEKRFTLPIDGVVSRAQAEGLRKRAAAAPRGAASRSAAD